jgi:hypothetical protein
VEDDVLEEHAAFHLQSSSVYSQVARNFVMKPKGWGKEREPDPQQWK